ncbi:Cation/H(+) antiporter 15 [Rhynchospora pubera]|uniref:Cation/H(+) antiporter 15 n=1 Tax=Rhynchospora pubera TaxID=906938 RepID=A0AAV8HUC5_9POAL|nr:Cation/H(+) antiporter 15 [Rhynchospora pubera]
MDLQCYRAQDESTFNVGIWEGANPLTSSLSLLSVQLIFIILLTQFLFFILKPIKQPRIVAEILAGIILGPSFLGSNKTFKKLFYPARGEQVLETISTLGVMFFIFVIGVKTDLRVMFHAGKRAPIIGIIGLIVCVAVVMPSCMSNMMSMEPDVLKVPMFMASLSVSLSINSVLVIVPILSDLNLLNSELGRIALSGSMTNDFVGWSMLSVIIVSEASAVSSQTAIWAALSIVALVLFIVLVVRPFGLWVVEKTPQGKPVEEGYVFVFLLLLLLVIFYTDIIGANSFTGALILGLLLPDGPPLGSALTEKIEIITKGLIVPLYYTVVGSKINLWHLTIAKMPSIIFLGVLGKMVGILLPSLYYKIPFLDALALSLVMVSKGIVEVMTYNFWMSIKLIDRNTYSILIVSVMLVPAICIPIASTLYDPSRCYAVYKRRTIQHLREDAELRILACVHDQSHVPGMLNLLEASYPTIQSPICVYLLQLVELVGRLIPIFIPHKIDRSIADGTTGFEADPIINAFLLHEQSNQGVLSVAPFTTISPYASMHDEVCRMAVDKRVSLILLHFHQRTDIAGHIKANNGLRTMNKKVISGAPCSVAILIDRQATDTTSVANEFMHEVVVLFFGGCDDREALAYGERMARHPGISLTVIRFLPSRGIKDDQAERKLDNQSLDEIKAIGLRTRKVRYMEELVGDMENIVQVIRSLDRDSYDLVMVGMRHTWNAVMANDSLSDWSECPELGVVGDFLATAEFDSMFSILIVKQQDQGGILASAGYNAPVHGEDLPTH